MLAPFLLIAAIVMAEQLAAPNWIVRGFSVAGSYVMYAGQILPSPLRVSGFGEPFLYLILLASGLCAVCLMTFAIPAWSSAKKFLGVFALFVLPGMLTLLVFQAADEINRLGMLLAYTDAALSF